MEGLWPLFIQGCEWSVTRLQDLKSRRKLKIPEEDYIDGPEGLK